MLQTDTRWHDPEWNRGLFSDLLDEVPNNSSLVILPEMFSTGFTMDSLNRAETMNDQTVGWMLEKANAIDAAICGSLIISENTKVYNRLIWASPHGELFFYDKRHLFRMANEHRFFSPGTDRLIVEHCGWRIAPSICYDLRFPVWLRNRDDYDLTIFVANWPSKRQIAWSTLLRARAIENVSYSCGVNVTGVDGAGVEYAGGSSIFDPVGEPIAEHFEDRVVATHTLSGAFLVETRTNFPANLDNDKFSIEY